jgi:hypothetical protein
MTRALDMDEAAEELRVSRRAFQDILKRHPFYYPNGRRKLFTEKDIEAIQRGLREEEQCRLSSSRQGQGKRRTITSGGRTSDTMWTKARELLSNQSRPDSSKASVKRSNVVSFNPDGN